MVGNPLGHKKEYSPFAGFEEAEIVNSGEVQASEALFVALAVSSLVYLSVDAFTRRLSLRVIDWCLQDSVASGSIVVLSLVFASLTILLVALGYPMSLLCVLGGYLYSKTLGAPLGILVSTIVTSVATTLGCVLSFVVTRAVLRERASEWLQSSSTLEGLDVALRQQGLRVNLLMRLSPIVPYGFLNLAMGLTATSLDDYTLGCLGILPSAIVLSYFGTALTKLQDLGTFADRRPAEMAVLYVSGALLVVWVATTLYLATKRAIAQVVKRRESLVDSYGWEL